MNDIRLMECVSYFALCSRNERLFQEMYEAWLTGRSEKDPSEGWYNGEIWFYDNYIIPLAKKLKDCGVFGVASDEYLNYGMSVLCQSVARCIAVSRC